MSRRIRCPKAEYTRDKIQCTAIKSFCVYQRFRQCKNEYWHTDGALGCKARAEEWRREDGE